MGKFHRNPVVDAIMAAEGMDKTLYGSPENGGTVINAAPAGYEPNMQSPGSGEIGKEYYKLGDPLPPARQDMNGGRGPITDHEMEDTYGPEDDVEEAPKKPDRRRPDLPNADMAKMMEESSKNATSKQYSDAEMDEFDKASDGEEERANNKGKKYQQVVENDNAGQKNKLDPLDQQSMKFRTEWMHGLSGYDPAVREIIEREPPDNINRRSYKWNK